MTEAEATILSLGLLIISSINLIMTLTVIKQRKRHQNKSTLLQHEETDESTGTAEQQKVETQGQPTKFEIMSSRRKIIHEIEQERGTRVITMIHKRELWTGPGEQPEIEMEDAETVLQQIRSTPPDKPIDLILHTPGGIALAAEMMAMAIKLHPQKVTVMVPFYALSGGSMMSLAADEIRMEKYSMLGPVDPQIPTPDGNTWPAGSLESLVRLKPLLKVSDRMIVMADAAKLEIENAVAFVMWLLDERMDVEAAKRVAEFFAHGYIEHATPITLDVVRAIGLDVVEGIPENVYELFKTFGFAGTPYELTS
jgi:ATP-dependent protease ClpP protease subunit